MKSIYRLIIVLLLTFTQYDSFAQEAFEIDTLKFEETTVEEVVLSTKQGTRVWTYKSKSGEFITIGDTLKIGMPKNNLSDKYVTIQSGKLKGSTKFVMGNTPIKLNTNWSGRELIVLEMYAGHLGGGKKQPLGIYLYLGNANDVELMKGLQNLEVTNLDAAIEQGEILTKKYFLSKSDAIKKLKEAKDLLDLGVITVQEFEKQKSLLTPIILKEN